MTNFRSITKFLLMLIILAGFIFSGCATAPKPGAIVVDEVSRTATVVSVDMAKRVVTLKKEDGSTQSYVVSEDVKNLDQVKPGDIVKSSILESVAIYVRKSNEAPDATVSKSISLAPKGEKPGMVLTDTFELIAKVEGIDLNKGTIAVKAPDGSIKSFVIDKSVDNFKNIKVGDDVILNVTVAIIIDVEKPAGK
jgi:hypothetical protein